MNDLIIKTQKVDWLKIIDLALKRKNWGKAYTLYSYGTTTISSNMYEFNFETSTAWFKLHISYFNVRKGMIISRYDTIRYALNNFSLDDFKMHLNKKTSSLLKETERQKLLCEAETKFSEHYIYYGSVTEEQIRSMSFGSDYDSIDEIDNEEIKEECLEVLKDKTRDVLIAPYHIAIDEYVKNTDANILGFKEIINSLEITK